MAMFSRTLEIPNHQSSAVATFPGPVLSASASLEGFSAGATAPTENSILALIEEIQIDGDRVKVHVAASVQRIGFLRVLVNAEVDQITSLVNAPISVSVDSQGELKVEPDDCVMTEAGHVHWTSEGCDIVAVLGLPAGQFSRPKSIKNDAGATLAWQLYNFFRTDHTRSFYYSILAIDHDSRRLLFKDPKVTNEIPP